MATLMKEKMSHVSGESIWGQSTEIAKPFQSCPQAWEGNCFRFLSFNF